VSEITPNLTDTSRCISVHWSLPVQCVLPRPHRENWHEAWHPDTRNRIRYRRTLGVFATEELRGDGWCTLPIPPPERVNLADHLTKARAEVERLRNLAKSLGSLHHVHRCDGPPEDCPCADDREEAGGDVCAHCRWPWPCTSARFATAALNGGETS
jgi:hypothetical protein